ncbi:MAG: T9SS C-terminal target domain-containing protein [Bacteroidetes bacterium]|nr:MAG: T9SS C-terminal target domain-containing protein [Bacteroidota bacterium]
MKETVRKGLNVRQILLLNCPFNLSVILNIYPMIKWLSVFSAGLLLLIPGLKAQNNLSRINPSLYTTLSQNPDTYVEVEILLAEQADLESMELDFRKRKASLEERAYSVITALQQTAAATQGPLNTFLQSHPGVMSGSVESYWIANVIRAHIRLDAALALDARNDVWMVLPVVQEELSDFVRVDASPEELTSVNGREPGHTAINAPAMWKLGYTGQSRKVLVIDSGVDITHPALKDNYYGLFSSDTLAWYGLNESSSPTDCDEHGSHVTGTVCGLNRSTNDTIGVAFNALWMGAPAIDNDENGPIVGCQGGPNSLQSLQWAINPDGNSSTTKDMPDVVNNSWGGPNGGNSGLCNTSSTLAINALEVAGIAAVFSAGNRGDEGAGSIGSPAWYSADTVNAFSVGAINAYNPSYPLGSFSSQGPTLCAATGSLQIKPEVVAPGVNVRSSVPGGGYAQFLGTSMAAPHVSGALLLLKEAFPNLPGRDLKLALYYTATDLGVAGEDNLYGNGLINVKAAYDYLVAKGNTPSVVDRSRDAAVAAVTSSATARCDTSAAPTFTLKNKGTSPLTTAEIGYSFSDGFSSFYTWTGNLAPNATATVTLPAHTLDIGYHTFNVEITTVNGVADYFFLDNTGSGSITVLGNAVPTVGTSFTCIGGQAALLAESNDPNAIVRWYTAPTGGSLVFEGDNFITPPLTQQAIYWMTNLTRTHIGKPDKSTGSGLYFQGNSPYINFNVSYPVTLKSVKVYAALPGIRNVVLRGEAGNVIDAKIDTLTLAELQGLVDGEYRIELNFPLTPGENYQLGLSATSVGGLYYSTSAVSFPYTFANLVTLTSSVTNNQPSNNYYFFYDWEVQYESPCARKPAFVTVGAGTVDAAFTSDKTTVNLAVSPTVQFTSTSTGATSQTWNFGDGSTSTAANPAHNYYAAGDYLVTLTATSATNCTDIDTLLIRATGTYPFNVGVEEELEKGIRIYPNPSRDRFTLDFELDRSYRLAIEVVDQLGREVLRIDETSYANDEVSLDLSSLADGVYYIRLTGSGYASVRKLVKEQ